MRFFDHFMPLEIVSNPSSFTMWILAQESFAHRYTWVEDKFNQHEYSCNLITTLMVGSSQRHVSRITALTSNNILNIFKAHLRASETHFNSVW